MPSRPTPVRADWPCRPEPHPPEPTIPTAALPSYIEIVKPGRGLARITLTPHMTEALHLPVGTVLRDGSQTIWVKQGLFDFQRPGSSQFYDESALVYPWTVLWPTVVAPGPAGG